MWYGDWYTYYDRAGSASSAPAAAPAAAAYGHADVYGQVPGALDDRDAHADAASGLDLRGSYGHVPGALDARDARPVGADLERATLSHDAISMISSNELRASAPAFVPQQREPPPPPAAVPTYRTEQENIWGPTADAGAGDGWWQGDGWEDAADSSDGSASEAGSASGGSDDAAVQPGAKMSAPPPPLLWSMPVEQPTKRQQSTNTGRPGQRSRLGMKERIQREALRLCDEEAQGANRRLDRSVLTLRKALSCVREHIMAVGRVATRDDLAPPSDLFRSLQEELENFHGFLNEENQECFAQLLHVVEDTMKWCEDPAPAIFARDTSLWQQRDVAHTIAYDVLEGKRSQAKKRAGLKSRLHVAERQQKGQIVSLQCPDLHMRMVAVNGTICKLRKIQASLRDHLLMASLQRRREARGDAEVNAFLRATHPIFTPIVARMSKQAKSQRRSWSRKSRAARGKLMRRQQAEGMYLSEGVYGELPAPLQHAGAHAWSEFYESKHRPDHDLRH